MFLLNRLETVQKMYLIFLICTVKSLKTLELSVIKEIFIKSQVSNLMMQGSRDIEYTTARSRKLFLVQEVYLIVIKQNISRENKIV